MIPDKGINTPTSLRAARADVSKSESGGLHISELYRRRKSTKAYSGNVTADDVNMVGPISLKETGPSGVALMPLHGESGLDYENYSKAGSRDWFYYTKQDQNAQLNSYSCSEGNHSSTGRYVSLSAAHKNYSVGSVGVISRHWMYIPDDRDFKVHFRVSNTSKAGNNKVQTEVHAYKDGWAQGDHKLVGYVVKSVRDDYYETSAGNTEGRPYVMVTIANFSEFCSTCQNRPAGATCRISRIYTEWV